MDALPHVLSVPLDGRPMTVIDELGVEALTVAGDPLGVRLSTESVPSRGPWVVVEEVGAALGYPAGSLKARLAEWSDRLRHGRDVLTLSGPALGPLKDAGVVGRRARAVLLLSESGLYRVLMLSGQPAALRLQEWLADEVLPVVARGGSVRAASSRRAVFEAAIGAFAIEQVAFWGHHQAGSGNLYFVARVLHEIDRLPEGPFRLEALARRIRLSKPNTAWALFTLAGRGFVTPLGKDPDGVPLGWACLVAPDGARLPLAEVEADAAPWLAQLPAPRRRGLLA